MLRSTVCVPRVVNKQLLHRKAKLMPRGGVGACCGCSLRATALKARVNAIILKGGEHLSLPSQAGFSSVSPCQLFPYTWGAMAPLSLWILATLVMWWKGKTWKPEVVPSAERTYLFMQQDLPEPPGRVWICIPHCDVIVTDLRCRAEFS